MLFTIGLIVAIYAVARLLITVVENDGLTRKSQIAQGIAVGGAVLVVVLAIWLFIEARDLESLLTPFDPDSGDFFVP